MAGKRRSSMPVGGCDDNEIGEPFPHLPHFRTRRLLISRQSTNPVRITQILAHDLYVLQRRIGHAPLGPLPYAIFPLNWV